jgi:hypothetical protein
LIKKIEEDQFSPETGIRSKSGILTVFYDSLAL